MPAVDVLVASLGEQQKMWIDVNVDKLSPFLQSENGREALLIFLSEFNDFVNTKM